MTLKSTLCRLSLLTFGAFGTLGLAPAATAQNLFAPAAMVDETVVTEFEVQQRQRFMQLLNAPGATRDGALEALIEDRLKNTLLKGLGFELEPEGLQSAMEEFAGRANLSAAEFISALEGAGVNRETFRDFIVTSIGWREVIRARYNSRVQISESEIERALGANGAGNGIRVLLSEIIIPAPPQRAAQVNALADRISQSNSIGEFSGYARRYSATASRGAGGRLPWQTLDKLPPSLQQIVLALAPGEVSDPLPIPNAVALFQLRAIEETSAPRTRYSEIEYAAYYMDGGRSEATLAAATKLRGDVDRCDDLYATAKGQPESVLDRGSKAPGDIPQDIAIELSKLDPGEVSTALTRANGQTLVFLMLCNRTAEVNADVSREAVINSLRQQRLQGYADRFLEQLRADARIDLL